MGHNTKLGLGGHSFIQELGNDPAASFEEQCAIVADCLDNGVQWIDTTYYQERVALGKVLQHLGRRNEARITAWNFFQQPGKENELVGFTPYEPDSIQKQLAELQTEYLDLLVIHSHNDLKRLRAEFALALGWQEAGLVKHIGLGMARREHLDLLADGVPFTYVLAPYNAFHTQAADLFTEAKQHGLTTIAMSPFVRGWNLDKIGGDTQAVAGTLLRWLTAQGVVDTVFVSMRRAEWVAVNLEAERHGSLSEEENAFVPAWVSKID